MQFVFLHHDQALLLEIGHRLARRRLELNLTQAALAEQSGVAKRTIERVEGGESTQLSTFLRLLRGLDWLDHLELLLPERGPGPLELLKTKGKERKRASSSANSTTVREGKPTPWTWGDEATAESAK